MSPLAGSAAYNSTTGNYNESIGSQALFGNTTGRNNIGVGYQAGFYPKTGSNNIEIGSPGCRSRQRGDPHWNTRNIEEDLFGWRARRKCNGWGGGDGYFNRSVRCCFFSPALQRGYSFDGDSSDPLRKLRPVKFRYKQPDDSGQKPEQYGLIAEEVAQVMPERVVYNDKGQPETVAYQTLAPLLLNELQREHKQMEKMQTEIDELRKARIN